MATEDEKPSSVSPFHFWREIDLEASTVQPTIKSDGSGSSPRGNKSSVLHLSKNFERAKGSKAENGLQTSSKKCYLSPPLSAVQVSPRFTKKSKILSARQETANRHVSLSDANSYTPIQRKSPSSHKKVLKTTSNPMDNRHPHTSIHKNTIHSKQVPTIQTISDNTSDHLSIDDLELYRPQRNSETNRVLDIAKQIDSVFLNVQQQPAASGARRRCGSSENIDIRKSLSDSRDSIRTTASSPGPYSSITEHVTHERFRNWRSQNSPKIRSGGSFVKIKSSFTSYLDGPIEPSSPPDKPHPPAPPPPSPLHTMSNFLKTNNVPEGNHLQPCHGATQETIKFWEMVQRIQSQCYSGNSISLMSPVLSQQFKFSKHKHDSVYLTADSTEEMVAVRIMEGNPNKAPAEFTCKVTSTVQSVLSRGLDHLCRKGSSTKVPEECCLKVCGRDEIFENHQLLSDYEYVHQSRKFVAAVELVIVEKKKPSPLRDRRSLLQEYNSSAHVNKSISMKEANALLDSYHAKEDKFRGFLESKLELNYPFGLLTMVQSVVSCVKLLCERLSFIEPPEISDAVYNLRRACKAASQPELEASSFFTPEDSISLCSSASDNWVSVPDKEFCISSEHIKDIINALDVLRKSVHLLLSLYCLTFHPGYFPKWDDTTREVINISSSENVLRIKVSALHRPLESELRKYDTLQLECCVYHGGRALSKRAYSPHAKLSRNFFKTVVWNKWLNMSLPLSSLPRESRVLFTLHGLEFPGSGIKWSRTPIAWCILRLFECNGYLLRGSHLISMWLGEEADPFDSPYSNIHDKNSMILQVELEDFKHDLCHDTQPVERHQPKSPGPPPNVSKTITTIAQKDRFCNMTTSDQKIIWANRLACVSLLGDYPRGLPIVLIASQSSNSKLSEVWKIIEMWKFSDPIFGLELLDPQFADMKVREKAVEWLANLSNDDICDFLPQLVQSLRYDSYLSSPMAEFLLERSTQSHRIAHALFWHLQLVIVTDIRFQGRYSPILEALQKLCGEELHQEFINQVELVEQLCGVATAVKNARDSHRQTTLVQELKMVVDKFIGEFRLPLNPSLLVKDIDIESCSFFNSNTVPLKLSFINSDPFGQDISIIFKVGDDLRQDIVILQMIRLMEKIWLRAGLDLKMVTYQCVATGEDQGMLELVGDAATLRAIQTEHGLTGSFKDKPLSEWLQRHNSTESAYKQAVENFTLSCAGYCVATYVLGICDRHNDNIMIKKSGHMFHIDFGKILGNAQMLGNIKRDRTPFVLTRDMAYVINDGDKPTTQFQKFCDLCCTAYNELRKHTTLFISLLSLILSSGLPEISSLDDVKYVRDALLPGKSESEATFAFTKYIEDSLGSIATTLNFFIHNLAQFKFSSTSNAPSLLSFCPQAYSIATDGKIESAIITTYHKWFYPETYYVYQIEVKRSAPGKEKIFRRYREFDELQSKLEQCFPDADLPQLPGKIFIPGKSHTKQTTEHRMVELNMYLASILSMPTQISESDIIYTFLHCLIRDEQDFTKLIEGDVHSCDHNAGKVKLEMLYSYKQEMLTVMIRHVKDLIPREGSDTADPYVKLYLLPDPNKSTKQKTKICRRTLNPTYNETFSYSISPSSLSKRALQLSIWDASNVLSNNCISMTTIELSKLLNQLNSGSHFIQWFELYSLPNLL